MAAVFLTGASGFLGRHVSARLRERGHVVTALTRRMNAADPAGPAADLTRPASYEAALAGVDTVVHLAAVTGKAAPAEYARVNVDGTRGLADAARRAGVTRFLFCSSIAVAFPDTSHYPYAESKAAGERIVAASGLRFATIRPTIIGGPGSPVIAKLASLAALPIIPAFGGGTARVQPILVDDLASLMVDLVDADRFSGEVLELGGRDVLSLRDLLGRLHSARRQTPPRFLPVPMGLILAPLRLIEPLLGHSLPMTIGQLATFRFDGVARPNSLWEARRDQLATLDQILAPALA